jgi:uncharacterized protein YfaQ (DUF2300 family)
MRGRKFLRTRRLQKINAEDAGKQRFYKKRTAARVHVPSTNSADEPKINAEDAGKQRFYKKRTPARVQTPSTNSADEPKINAEDAGKQRFIRKKLQHAFRYRTPTPPAQRRSTQKTQGSSGL